jgi:hypothetical protein
MLATGRSRYPPMDVGLLSSAGIQREGHPDTYMGIEPLYKERDAQILTRELNHLAWEKLLHKVNLLLGALNRRERIFMNVRVQT